jgi:hypothetical protein
MSNPFKVGDDFVFKGPAMPYHKTWGVTVGKAYRVFRVYNTDPATVEIQDDLGNLSTFDVAWSVSQEAPAVKPSNPKDVIGSTKPPLHNVPCGPLYQIGAAMLSGACKYGSHNWRSIGVRSDVYYDAVQRHIMSWWEGETLDPESGAPHLAHVAACCIILLDAEAAGKLTDNRPPVVGNPSQAVQELVTSILQKYPNPVEPFTEKNNA